MCPPLIAIIAAIAPALSVAATIGGTIASVIAQSNAAKAQEQMAKQQRDFENSSAQIALQQARDVASEELLNQRINQAAARGEIQAAGIAPNSIGRFLRETDSQVARNIGIIKKQEKLAESAAVRSLIASDLDFRGKLQSIDQPDFVGLGLSLVASGVSVAGLFGGASGAVKAGPSAFAGTPDLSLFGSIA